MDSVSLASSAIDPNKSKTVSVREHERGPSQASSSRELAGQYASSSVIDAHQLQHTAALTIQPEALHTSSSDSGSIQNTGNKSKRLYCSMCGRMGHAQDACVFGHNCNACGRRGHLERNCHWKVHCRLCNRHGHSESDCSKSCEFCGSLDHAAAECERNTICDVCEHLGHVKENYFIWRKAVRRYGPEANPRPHPDRKGNSSTNSETDGCNKEPEHIDLSTYLGVRERARIKKNRRRSF